MPEMKSLNGYEIVDAKAREDIEALKSAGVDLTGYATETYVDQAISNIPEVDLSQHALKSEIPTNVSQLENDSKFITREEVPEVDLSEYAKKSEIPDVSDFITNIPSEYITEDELEAKGYLTEHQPLDDYALKSELPKVPTNVSALTNDAGYITQADVPDAVDTSNFLTKVSNNDQYLWYVTAANSHQIIQNYIPIEKSDSALDVVVGGKTLSSNSIAVREGLQLRVPETPTNNNHAASKKYVDSKIASIPTQDLSNYALKSSVPTKVSQLTNDKNYLTSIPDEYLTAADLAAKGYLTSIPSEYITESELNAKGYLTQHQPLTGYATEVFVTNKIAEAKLEGEGETVDLSGYATKDDIKNFITEIPSEYVTESELNNKGYITDVSNLAPKSSIPTKVSQLTNDKNYLTAIPDDYVTESDLNAKGYITDISGKADKNHEHTQYLKQDDFNNWEQVFSGDLEDRYAQKTYVDNAVSEIVADFELKLPSSYSKVTDAMTISYLDQCLSGKLPNCFIGGRRVIAIAGTSSTYGSVRLFAMEPAAFTDSTYTYYYDFIRQADNSIKYSGVTKREWPHVTKTSELTNDSDFTTKTYVDEEISALGDDLAKYVDEAENRLIKSIPTNNSQLTNSAGYITKTTADSNYYPKASGQTNAADIATIKANYVSQDKLLVMTSSAYNSLSTKDSNTFYFIKES